MSFFLSSAQKDQSNVVRGLKAAIHNPRVSEEAKQRDIQRLQAMEEYEGDTTTQDDSEHHHRVMGGYKATLSNLRTSEAAKEHAQQMLGEAERPRLSLS